MTKTLNQIIFFSLHQNQNIFFSNIGNRNIFLEKKNNPPPLPLQVKWSFPYEFLANKYEKLEDTKEVFRKNRPNEKGEKRGQKMKLNIDQYNRDKPMCSRGVRSSWVTNQSIYQNNTFNPPIIGFKCIFMWGILIIADIRYGNF